MKRNIRHGGKSSGPEESSSKLTPQGAAKSLSVLMVLEHFPSYLHPNLINPIEAVLERGGEVTLVANRQEGSAYPPRVNTLGLLDHLQYFEINSIRDLLHGLRLYLLPFTHRGREAHRGLYRLLWTAGGRWSAPSLRAWLKAVVRAPLLADARFDLVHAHVLGGAYDYLFIPRILDIPLVTTFRGMPPVGVKGLPLEKLAEVFKYGDLFLANTGFAGKQLEQLGCPAEKIRVLNQGVRLEDYPFQPRMFPEDGRFVILTVARLSEEKGLRFGIEAMARLRERFPKLQYRIVGPGPNRVKLEALVRELGLEAQVQFLGPLVGTDLAQQRREAHLFVLPSISIKISETEVIEEVQGSSMQEAQASGLIVVATRIGGLPEVIEDGRAGFLVPQKDSEALAQKIAWVFDHPELWETWQREGRKWVETRFDAKLIGQRLWEIYQGLCQRRAGIQPNTS